VRGKRERRMSPLVAVVALFFLRGALLARTCSGADVLPSVGVPAWAEVQAPVLEIEELAGVAELVELRQPGVVRGGAREWPAVERWRDEDYLKAKLDGIPIKSIVSDADTNIYHAPMRSMVKTEFETEDLAKDFGKTVLQKYVLNLSFPELMESLSDRAPFYYGTTDLASICSVSSICDEDLGPKSSLWLDDPKLHEKPEGLNQVHLWIGKEGIISGTHYDAHHNVHVQIVGHKRFLLIDTKEWNKLLLFPYTHPHSRHSMLELRPLRKAFRGILPHQIPMYIVDLNPGDVLYIPPHWFHRVLPVADNSSRILASDQLSISVNGWAVSTEAIFAGALRKVALPTIFGDKDAEPIVKAAALRLLLTISYMNIFAVMEADALDFMFRVFEQRYRGYIGRALKCDAQGFKDHICPGEIDSVLIADQQTDVAKAARRVEMAFYNAKTISGLRVEALEMIFADFMEVLADFLFGYPEACHYLRCIAFFDHAACPAQDLEDNF